GAVFNPWWQADDKNDIGENALGIRRKQLRAYLGDRLGKVRLAIVGEALGYRGGHFTGIPMTSERILLGRNKNVGIGEKQLLSAASRRLSSKRSMLMRPASAGFAILLPAARSFFASKSPRS